MNSFSVIFQTSVGTETDENNSFAPHKEFIKPDNIAEPKVITEDITFYEFSYNYEMNYDVPPKNIVFHLEGEMDNVSYEPEFMLSIIRPDGVKFSRIVDESIIDSNTNFEKTLNLKEHKNLREEVFKWAQKSDSSEDKKPFQIDPVKILLSKENENILTDPEPLKGEYRFKIAMTGKNVDFEFDKEGTCLFIMSEEPSEVKNLEGTYENGKVSLTWDEPEDTGGSDIIQYNIYRATTMYNYDCIDTVDPNKTEYVDDFSGENTFSNYESGFKGDVLFYRIAAVNKDNSNYVRSLNSSWSLSEIPVQNQWKPLSVQEVVYIPIQNEKKSSDLSYKWVMDYSDFTEEDFENRLDRGNVKDMTGVKINELTGGDVFFYEVDYLNKEDGERKYEYNGGFYSKGEADIEIHSTSSPSRFKIDVKESWIKFSGNIWAKEISTDGYEGLSITKQTIESEGKIKSSVNGTYDFEFYGEDMHWETSKKTDIEWDLDLTLDYEGNNSWVIDQKKSEPVPPASYDFNYTGSLNAQVNINKDNNHDYSAKDVEKSIDRQFSKYKLAKVLGIGHLHSEFTSRKFTPIIGASRVGYCLAFSQALDTFSHDELTSEWGQFSPIRDPFNSNSQSYDFSKDELYSYQCLDPMVVPGLGSLIGTEFKRAESIHHKKQVEVLIKEKIRKKINMLDPDVNESAWREMREEQLKNEIWGAIFTSNDYILDQQEGPLGKEMVQISLSKIEPLGYFTSQPADEDDMNSFDDDKEKFFDNQMSKDDSDGGVIPGFSVFALMMSLVFIIIYKSRK